LIVYFPAACGDGPNDDTDEAITLPWLSAIVNFPSEFVLELTVTVRVAIPGDTTGTYVPAKLTWHDELGDSVCVAGGVKPATELKATVYDWGQTLLWVRGYGPLLGMPGTGGLIENVALVAPAGATLTLMDARPW
jgi:hypothetical protein